VITLEDSNDSGDDIGQASSLIHTSVSDLTTFTDSGIIHGSQFLREANGLSAFSLNAGDGSIVLRNTEGSIQDSDGDVDVVSDKLLMVLEDANDSGDDAGSGGDFLMVQVRDLTVDTAAGLVHGSQFINEVDNLDELNLNAGTGDISLTSGGRVLDGDSDLDICRTPPD
jgi:hypothetical protein